MPDPDPVQQVLLKATSLTQSQKHDAWSAVMSAANDAALESNLRALDIPQELKHDLFEAKGAVDATKKAPANTAANTYAIVGGKRVPLGGDEADVMPRQTALEQLQNSGGAQDLRNIAGGVRAGVMNTAFHGGDLIRRGYNAVAPESMQVDRVINTPEAQAAMTRPSGVAGGIGYYGEQAAEIPSDAIASVTGKVTGAVAPSLAPYVGKIAAKAIPAAVVGAATTGGVSAVQGGNPVAGAVMGAAIPVAGAAIEALPDNLKAQAVKQVEQALGATKERFKSLADRIAPEVLQRGLAGSRETLKTQSAAMVDELGPQIDQALQQFGQRTANSQPVLDALENAKEPYRLARTLTVQDAAQQGFVKVTGQGVIPTDQYTRLLPNGAVEHTTILDARPIEQLEKLKGVIQDIGQNPTVEQLVGVRRAWDSIVGQAGGYAHRAAGAIGLPLMEQSEAWAKKQGATAIRQLLNSTAPELADINKEFTFWKRLDDVLGQTLQRTAPQGPSLAGEAAKGTGAVVGALASGPGGSAVASATALAAVNKMVQATLKSPRWKLASARMKDNLADAIMSNKVQNITAALARITAVSASKIGGDNTPPDAPR